MKMKLCQLILAAVTVGSLTATLHAQDAGLEQWTNDRSRNPKKGGWVSTSAGVSELVYLAPTAKILGSASVQGAVRIYGNAVVSGEAFVKYADSGVTSENLNIYGNALVTGDATVNGAARIYGNAQISENASILGEPAIYENAVIQGHATVKDQATVCGHAIVSGDALVGGTAIIRGYARLSTGTYTNGVVEPAEPAEEIAARLAQAEREQKEAQAAAEKNEALKDFYARFNKTFKDIYISGKPHEAGKSYTLIRDGFDGDNADEYIKSEPTFKSRENLDVYQFNREIHEAEFKETVYSTPYQFKLHQVKNVEFREEEKFNALTINFNEEIKIYDFGQDIISHEHESRSDWKFVPMEQAESAKAFAEQINRAVEEYRRLTGQK